MMLQYDGITTIVALFLAVVAVVCQRLLTKTGIERDGLKLRNPPNTLPIIGNGFYFLKPRWQLLAWFARCQEFLGEETYEISVPTLPPGVVVSDPRNIEYVFKNEGLFGKGDFLKSRMWDLFGRGIINVDGEMWKTQRKAGLNFLNTRNLRILTDVALPRILAKSVSLLRTNCGDGSVVDLQDVYMEITSQLMGKMAYDMEMHAEDPFTKAFDYASGATAERLHPVRRLAEVFLRPRMQMSLAIVRAYGRTIVGQAKTSREDDDDTRDTPAHTPAPEDDERLEQISGSLINALLDAIPDESVVADAALNYLSAGRDTTAQALTWTSYLLMKHPRVIDKIRQEVSNLSSKNATTPDTSLFSPSSMPYTTAVFYETIRLYPPVPMEFKQTLQATTLPDGTFLPSGSIILWVIWAMNRSQQRWGDDADEFRPERWLTATDVGKRPVFVAKSAAEFPTFNGGPRTCLGKKMAELVAIQVIATMAQEFEIAPAFDLAEERTSETSLTMPMASGLPCYVKARRGM